MFELLQRHMPEVVMLPQDLAVIEKTDVTEQIQELKEFMDVVELMPDGFSDSESSCGEEQTSGPVHKHSKESSQSEKRLLHTLGRKNGLFERNTPLKLYKNKKPPHHTQYRVRPKSSGTVKTEKSNANEKKDNREEHRDKNDDGRSEKQDNDKEHVKTPRKSGLHQYNLNSRSRHGETECIQGSLNDKETASIHQEHGEHLEHEGGNRTDNNEPRSKDNERSTDSGRDQNVSEHTEHHTHHYHHHRHHHGKKHHHEESHDNHHHGNGSNVHHHHHHHGKHHSHGHGKSSGNKMKNNFHVNAVYESKELTHFDVDLFKPIIDGQCEDDLDVPIITPPPPPEQPKSRCGSARGTFYARPMAFNIFLVGEKYECKFEDATDNTQSANLLKYSEKEESNACFCASGNVHDDVLCGWESPRKGGRSKPSRRKRFGKTHASEITCTRLPQTMGKDPVIFHHYKEYIKYIERYRFYHTVGNVGRPVSYTKYEKGVDSDPYFSRLKSTLSSAMASPFYGFAQLIDEKIGSASSCGSAHDRLRSDDESVESTTEVRPYSMRDRGKALNLAPVRECTVPSLRPSERIDVTQLNQYLNLTTPPVPNNCLQFDIDDPKMKRFAYRTGNPVDSNTMLATGSRRGARTLRLGSAEFMKPGTPDSELRWSTEKRGLQRSNTVTTSTVHGNLIVGSTISSPVPPGTRAKSGGKVPPYVQFQKDNANKPSSPPHHVSGQRLKACDRVAELTGKESGRFSYTHAARGERPAPVIRTATAVDFKETYIPRNRSQTISLEVNHLGIRGQPYRQNEQMVLYKNRRAQAMRS